MWGGLHLVRGTRGGQAGKASFGVRKFPLPPTKAQAIACALHRRSETSETRGTGEVRERGEAESQDTSLALFLDLLDGCSRGRADIPASC